MAEMRERAIEKHCSEVDDFEETNRREREGLCVEIRELQTEYARAEADLAVARPVLELRAQLFDQMSAIKEEFAAQVSGACRPGAADRGGARVPELEALRRQLHECHSELEERRGEVETLWELCDSEQRARLRLREDRQRQGEPLPGSGAADAAAPTDLAPAPP